MQKIKLTLTFLFLAGCLHAAGNSSKDAYEEGLKIIAQKQAELDSLIEQYNQINKKMLENQVEYELEYKRNAELYRSQMKKSDELLDRQFKLMDSWEEIARRFKNVIVTWEGGKK